MDDLKENLRDFFIIFRLFLLIKGYKGEIEIYFRIDGDVVEKD